jgi:hypothetical protein
MSNPILIAVAIAVSAATPVAAQDQVGRYTVTMQVTGGEMILLDSATGKTWRLIRVVNQEGGAPIVWSPVPVSDEFATTKPQTPTPTPPKAP